MKKLSLYVSLIAFIEVLPFSVGLYNNSPDDLNVFLCGKGYYNDGKCPLKTAAQRKDYGGRTGISDGVTIFKAGKCGPEDVNTGDCVYFQGTPKSESKIGDSIVIQPRSGTYKGCIYYKELEKFNNGSAIVWKYGNDNGTINTNTPGDNYPYYGWGSPEGSSYCSGWKTLDLSDTTSLNGFFSEAVISGINIGPWNKQNQNRKYDYFNFQNNSYQDMYSLVPKDYRHCKNVVDCKRPQFDANNPKYENHKVQISPWNNGTAEACQNACSMAYPYSIGNRYWYTTGYDITQSHNTYCECSWDQEGCNNFCLLDKNNKSGQVVTSGAEAGACICNTVQPDTPPSQPDTPPVPIGWTSPGFY